MKRILYPAVVLVLTLLACGPAEARATDARPLAPAVEAVASSTVTGCGAAATTGSSVRKMTVDKVERSYRLFVPTSYDPAQPTPLVLNFHGLGGSGRQQETSSQMTARAEASGFITVAPDGTNNPRRWYIYGRSERGYVDDFAFVDALIDEVSARLCIDAKRVYATGMSNGAGLSSQLGCKLNDRFAAIAPVAGTGFPALDCKGKAPMPIVAFHGTDDELIPFEGGSGGRLGIPLRPIRENVKSWAQHNGCNLTLSSQRIASDVVLESYGGCTNGADARLYVIEGGGHSWPGAAFNVRGDKVTQSIDATALIWQFFAAHPKP